MNLSLITKKFWIFDVSSSSLKTQIRFPMSVDLNRFKRATVDQKIWNKSEVLLEHVGEHLENLGNMLTTHWNLIGTPWEQQKSSMLHFKNGTPTVSKNQNAHLFPFFGDAPQIDEDICWVACPSVTLKQSALSNVLEPCLEIAIRVNPPITKPKYLFLCVNFCQKLNKRRCLRIGKGKKI